MTALPANTFAPDNTGAMYDAVAEAVAIADTYVATAADFAAIRDARGLAYSLRCASAALITAAEMTTELRPSRQPGERRP